MLLLFCFMFIINYINKYINKIYFIIINNFKQKLIWISDIFYQPNQTTNQSNG